MLLYMVIVFLDTSVTNVHHVILAFSQLHSVSIKIFYEFKQNFNHLFLLFYQPSYYLHVMTINYLATTNKPTNFENHTPMMQQYLTLKADYQHALLLYRMGDFYELFFDDAKLASEILGITLTRRGTDKAGNQIPMAGVPFHSADGYIARLINAGQTVVVCEQVEDSTTGTGKGILQRKVVKTLTAGTLTDDNLILQGQIPTVIALSFEKSHQTIGIAQLNLAKGHILVQQLTANSLEKLQQELQQTLLRFDPSECLIDENLSTDWVDFLQNRLNCPIINQPHSHFLTSNAYEHLCRHLQVTTLAGFGLENKPYAQISASVVLHYGKQTQQSELPYVQQISIEDNHEYLQIDAISQQNLEIFKPVLSSGISLLSVVDNCQTPMGKRLLTYHLQRPLLNISIINQRLSAVKSLKSLPSGQFDTLTEILSTIYDIERICGRVGLLSARPTDLAKLRYSLKQTIVLSQHLSHCFNDLTKQHSQLNNDTPLLVMLLTQLPDLNKTDTFAELLTLLESAIVEEPPAHIRDGGMLKRGFHAELDHLLHLHDNVEETLEKLANQERENHTLPTLKVGFNKVSGFYFELSTQQAKNAPSHFTRRQTLKNCERFITPELKKIEEAYLSAQSQALSLEKKLYEELLIKLQDKLPCLYQLSQAIAYLDVLNNWANHARQSTKTNPWCCPIFNETNQPSQAYLKIVAGRHIVVEAGLQRQQSMTFNNFVANDCQLGSTEQPERLMLITGPNMGGKSTYMRQTALIVLLACCGSFVPAERVSLGNIQRIFTRIGSADDLASGKSTFMVEMIETANIMNQANANSLVLMDEVGRGTSTQDGLAIAHACINYLADKIGCLTLFATHYFELTELVDNHKKMFNQHLVTQEINGQLLLLHRIATGSTHRSFGLHVAKMAGVPKELLTQAQIFLDNQSQQKSDKSQLTINFETNNTETNHSNVIQDKLKQIEPDHLTPKQALELVYQLKELLNHN